jgi:hypothetical protein
MLDIIYADTESHPLDWEWGVLLDGLVVGLVVGPARFIDGGDREIPFLTYTAADVLADGDVTPI